MGKRFPQIYLGYIFGILVIPNIATAVKLNIDRSRLSSAQKERVFQQELAQQKLIIRRIRSNLDRLYIFLGCS